MLHSGRSRRRGDGCGCRVVSEGVWEGGAAISAICTTAPAASACPEPRSQFSCATRAVDVAWDNDCVQHEEGLSSSQVSLCPSSFAHQLCVLFRFPLLQALELSGLFLQLCNYQIFLKPGEVEDWQSDYMNIIK